MNKDSIFSISQINEYIKMTLESSPVLRDVFLRGEISNCVISGPIAFDIAVSRRAADKKGVSGPIAGDADILLFHNIEAGNNTIKAMVQFGDWIFGGVVLGAHAPIVLNSRSDSDVSKLFSIACACGI